MSLSKGRQGPETQARPACPLGMREAGILGTQPCWERQPQECAFALSKEALAVGHGGVGVMEEP